jgi:rod shape-determining protein MreC
MAVSRRGARPRFTLLLLVLTSVTLLTLDFRGEGALTGVRNVAREVLNPLQSLATAITRPIGNLAQGVFNYGDLEAENAQLRAQLDEARGAEAQAEDAVRESRALLDLQDIDFAGDIPDVTARVVSSTPSNFELAVVIDRGTEHGIAEDMPVISGSGLVGRVSEVSRNRSVVRLLTDLTFSVGVRFSGTGEVGVATGRGRRDPLRVDLVAATAPVKERELVVTSGLQQSAFPAGLPVGRVVSAKTVPGEEEKRVTVRPLVNLRKLAFVKVLQWSPA